MLRFLNAAGYQRLFEDKEQELRDCLVTLSAVINLSKFPSKVGAAVAAVTCPHTLSLFEVPGGHCSGLPMPTFPCASLLGRHAVLGQWSRKCWLLLNLPTVLSGTTHTP
jgi:hypothetical protein